MDKPYISPERLNYYHQKGIVPIKKSLENKIDKAEGKGLSSEDYTTDEKEKLATIEQGAEVNAIEKIQLNGTDLIPDEDRTVNIEVPGGGSGGSVFIVTVAEAQLYGGIAKVRFADGYTKIAVISPEGTAEIEEVERVGTAYVSAENGDYMTNEETISAPYYGRYEASPAMITPASIYITNGEDSLAGATATLTNGTKTKTCTLPAKGSSVLCKVGFEGSITITATDGSKTAEANINVTLGNIYDVTLGFGTVYGVQWSGSSETVWTRTDASALFTNPAPAVNNGTGSSPFDNLMPWSGMQKVTDSAGGVLVSIPKYWYKWTKSGSVMTLQICDKEKEGFYVSPAHADRGDGKGERDVVYVGRYHCASTYKSATGVKPLAGKTRADFRSGIHNLGSEYYQYDFAMYWTIMMLYLVEFADWNSQKVIGYGCGNNSSTENMGSTDNMQYHTGTNAASRTTYGHVQYRWIEDLWGNVYDWCDGIYFSGTNVYCIKNPNAFSDTSGGIMVGTRANSGGWISAWSVPTAAGFEYALYPSAVSGSESSYVCDYCSYNSSGVVLLVGGNYYQSQYHGAFSLNGYNAASYSSSSIGSRLQKLPSAA